MAVPHTREMLLEVPMLWWIMAAVVAAAILVAVWQACRCCGNDGAPDPVKQPGSAVSCDSDAGQRKLVELPQRGDFAV